MAEITGNVPAVVTPFRETGEIDFDAFVKLIEWHIERGVDGICVAGDNGESWALRFDERQKLASTAAETIDGRVAFEEYRCCLDGGDGEWVAVGVGH